MGQPSVVIQPPEKRLGNFREVSLGYPKKIVGDEAQRCPQCADALCTFGCPLGVDIPSFIRLLREGKTAEALKKIREQNPLPAICGRLCPAPCEKACILTKEDAPIGVRALERYAADAGRERLTARPHVCKGKKIAIIGSGPTGLTAAAELAKQDFQVTIFEAMEEPGGLLRYGIPEFRLPADVLNGEIHSLQNLGIEIKPNAFFRKPENVKRLFQEGFAAILLTLGGGRPVFPDMPGLNLGGVYFAQEFLMRARHFKAERIMRDPYATNIGNRIVVIGSNHAALDCARIAARLGREATVVFPHIEDEMKAVQLELREAKAEGVKIDPLTKPLAIVGNDKSLARGVKCQHMDFADPHSNGQWQLIPVVESEFTIEADTVIVALGQQRNEMIEELVGSEGVFVPEQSASTEGNVVNAIAAGKKIAFQISEYLKK